jgi:hypothetical protein
MKVEVRGNEIKCFYDGQLKITAKDDTFRDAGKIGLWTKADSVIYFDDFTVKSLGTPQSSRAPGKIMAQKLVDDLVAAHPDLVRVGLHLTPPNHTENMIVACNVVERIGRKSDPEDLKAMQSGKPVVLKEGGNFDITLPLHNASGKVIGTIGLTFKPQGNVQDSAAVGHARTLAAEVEKQIKSEAKLFESAG